MKNIRRLDYRERTHENEKQSNDHQSNIDRQLELFVFWVAFNCPLYVYELKRINWFQCYDFSRIDVMRQNHFTAVHCKSNITYLINSLFQFRWVDAARPIVDNFNLVTDIFKKMIRISFIRFGIILYSKIQHSAIVL